MLSPSKQSPRKRSALLICGFKLTGKDTFHRTYLTSEGILPDFNWKIYADPNTKPEVNINSICARYAFADKLKQECQELYHVPADMQDKKGEYYYVDGKKTSARQIWIDHGAKRRLENVNYWVDHVIETSKRDDMIAVTDFRFPNEFFHMDHFRDISTVRVYRSEVPEAPMDEKSEHSLDELVTDYLVLSSNTQMEEDEEFNKCITRFPQYKDFVRIN